MKRDELRPSSLLFVYLFLVIGCYIMGQAVGDALFLSAFPTYLPQVIFATAIVVGTFTSLYIRLSHRLRLEFLIIASLLFFSLGFILLWFFAQASGKAAYPLIYIWVYTMGAVGPTMGWTLANYSLTTREARRLFGFIGSGAILGAPCAGFLTADLTHRVHVKPENLLLLMALALGLCALSVRLLFVRMHGRMSEVFDKGSSSPEVPRNLRQAWTYICASRYLTLIAALVLVGCCTTAIIGYQFKLIAYQSFGGNKADLAAFFGRFNGYIGIASFFVQMFLTGRLLRRFGIRVTLFVMPTVFMAASMGLILAPALLTASILKGTQGLLRYSLDKSSTELLYLPITPARVKNQVKSFIDGFIWRVADGLAGLTLFVFGNKLKLSPAHIGFVNFAFLVVWIAIASDVRHEYLRVLRTAIERRRLDPKRTAAAVVDASTMEVLAQQLQGGEQQVLYGLKLLEIGGESAWQPLLGRLLDHPSAAVRQRAFQVLAESGRQPIIAEAEKMLGDDALEVRAEALRYLVVHAHSDPLELLQVSTDVPAHCLQAALLTYLARSGDGDHLVAAEALLETMLSATGAEAEVSHREAARALGTIPSPCVLHSELTHLLRHPNPFVVEQAMLSAGKLRLQGLIPLIIEHLGEPPLLEPARVALAQFGDEAVSELKEAFHDPLTPYAIRKRIPSALARIGTVQSAVVLVGSVVQSDPELRYEIIKGLNKIRTRNTDVTISASDIAYILGHELIGYYRSFQILAALEMQHGSRAANTVIASAVRERMEHEFERVFRLLALLYPSRDMYNAYWGLTSNRPQLQANALEVLEHLLPSQLYYQIIIGIDPDTSLAQRLSFAQRLCSSDVVSSTEALRILLHSGDRWLCACALHAIGQRLVAELIEDLHAVTHEDSLLDQTWTWTAIRLGMVESKGPIMPTALEKVDLLRKAPIFRHIPTQSLLRIATIASEVSWKPHETVYRQNTPAEAMFFLIKGEVELRLARSTERRGENELIGSLAALGGEAHTETAVAMRATHGLRIETESFFEAMAEDFNLTRGMLSTLAALANCSRQSPTPAELDLKAEHAG